MKWFNKQTIAFKILFLLILILIPVNVLFVISATLSNQTYRDEVVQANEGILNVYAARLQVQMDLADSFFMGQLVTGKELSQVNTEVEKEIICMSIYYLMQDEAGEYEFPAGMFCFDQTENTMYMVYEGVLTASVYDEVRADIRAHFETDDITGWQVVTWEEADYLIRCYQVGDLCMGIYMPVWGISEDIYDSLSYTDMEISLAAADTVSEGISGGDARILSDETDAGLVLMLVLPQTEIDRVLPQLQRSLLVVSVLMFAIVPILYLAIRKIVIHPLMHLERALERVESGDLEYRIGQHKRYAKEFVHINQSFNDMIDEILQLRDEKYEYELDRQKHEMISLQLQIKPHFLYNSFNDISNMALVGDYGGIRELMGYLAEYFRYTIRTGYELVPLQRELDFLKVYYAIMEMRHPGCFEYEIDVAPDAADIEILPLLIHTFVENTMSHAVKEGDFITNRIAVRTEGERIRIDISDDGEGIPEDILQQIEQKKKMKDAYGKEHIGIWNCYRRLQIFYHDDADIRITSAPMQGVQVVIDMPREAKEVQAAERQTEERIPEESDPRRYGNEYTVEGEKDLETSDRR